jgi:hypothetical protein
MALPDRPSNSNQRGASMPHKSRGGHQAYPDRISGIAAACPAIMKTNRGRLEVLTAEMKVAMHELMQHSGSSFLHKKFFRVVAGQGFELSVYRVLTPG